MKGEISMSLFEDGHAVYQEIKSTLKIYPSVTRLYRYKEPFMARRYDYDEKRYYYEDKEQKKPKKLIPIEETDRISLHRAKTTISDITLCNEFDLFVTFTFKQERDNVDAKKRQMAFWLNNQRLLHGKFDYVIVPEYHKDGVSIHFHALFKNYKGKLVPALNQKTNDPIYQNGRQVFNIKSYKAGFSTAVWIDNVEKVSSYVTKYMTKEMPKFKSKQRYWCSNGLKRPLKITNPILSDEMLKKFTTVYSNSSKEILETHDHLTDIQIALIANFGKPREDDLRIEEKYPQMEHGVA